MTYSQILDVINQNIKQNGNEEITGVVLNSVLRALLGFVNDGFITINDVIQILADSKSVNIVGSIGLTTDTASLPAGVYNTQTSGTYTNASGIVVKEGYYTLLRKLENGNWVLESEVEMPMQDLTPLENRTTALEAGLIMAEDDINTLEGIIQLIKDDVTALENKNGGDVEFGNTKNVEGGKVFNYVNNKSITKFDPTAYEGGYPIGALVFHDNNVWRSMVNLNTETPQKGTSKWNEVKFNSNSKITIKDLSQPLPKDYDGDMIPVWNESLKDWSTAFQVRESPLDSTIPVRSGDGNLKTDKAIEDADAISKINENIVIFNTISEAREYLSKTKYVDFGKVVFVKSEDTYYKVNRDKNDLVTLINDNGQLISFFDLNDTPDSGFDAFGKVLKVGENGKIVFENITKDDFYSNIENGLNVFLWNTETKAWESALATKNETSYSIAMRGENGVLEVGDAVNDREAINLGQLKDYANPNALIKPEVDGNLDDFPDVVVVNSLGDSAKVRASEFGKVKSVNGKTGDVVLKTSDLQNDSDYTTTTALNSHVNNKNNPHNVTKEQLNLGNVDNTSDLNKPISTATQTELNKKLDKPTTNNTNQFVILGDGSTAPKNDLGKNFSNTDLEVSENRKHTGTARVELAMPMIYSNASQRFPGLVDKSADATFNKIAVFDSQNNLGTAKLYTSEFIRIKNGSNIGFALKHRSENPNFYGLIGNQAIDLSLSYSTSSDNGANGYQSIAIGNNIKGTGDQSIGIGTMATTSSSSVSIGNIVTSGNYSVAIGSNSNASGSQATAVGNQAKATGFFSTSVGSSKAIGQRATAIGVGNIANVDYSNVLGGSFLNANVYKSVVLGFSNPIKTNQSTTTWVPTDDLFVVGNGNNEVNELSEALNLKKNGHLTLPSVTNDMIDTDPKSVITKEYMEIKLPKPPETGEYIFKSVDGVVSWVSI